MKAFEIELERHVETFKIITEEGKRNTNKEKKYFFVK